MSEVKVNKLSPRSGTTVTLGDSGDTISIPSGVTLSNAGTNTFASATITGDLTVDTNTLFVDASENTVVVGGTDASSWNTNADELVVAGASAGGMTFYNPTQSNIFFADGTTGSDVSRGRIQYVHSGDSLIFGTDATERARIDGSGNVLVGKTSSDRNTVGTELFSTGRTIVTRDGGTPLDINRKTSDGGGISFYKDNTNVGEIEITSSGIGITLGGTGTANKLDDYEEGIFNPTLTPSTSGSFTINNSENELGYKKIGTTVYVQGRITFTGNSSPSGTNINVTNLPFTPGSPSEGSGFFGGMCAISNDGSNTFTAFPITAYSASTVKITTNLVSSLGSNARIHFNFFYYTSS